MLLYVTVGAAGVRLLSLRRGGLQLGAGSAAGEVRSVRLGQQHLPPAGQEEPGEDPGAQAGSGLPERATGSELVLMLTLTHLRPVPANHSDRNFSIAML